MKVKIIGTHNFIIMPHRLVSPRNILGSWSPYSRWNGGRGTCWQRAVKALTLCYNGAGHPSPQFTTNSSTGVRSERWKRHKSRYLYKPSLHRLWNLWSYDGNIQMRKTLLFCLSETIQHWPSNNANIHKIPMHQIYADDQNTVMISAHMTLKLWHIH